MAVVFIEQKVVSDGRMWGNGFCTSQDAMPIGGLASGSHLYTVDTYKDYYYEQDAEAWFEKSGSSMPDVTISFAMQGHGTQVSDLTVTWNTAATKPSDPTQTGYTFGGWYTDPACTTAWVWTDKVLKRMTLYAKWTVVEYTITYNLDGGTNSANNPAKFTIESGDIVFEDATKDGYTFDGWYGNNSFTGDKVLGVTSGSHANVAVYAKFTENEE